MEFSVLMSVYFMESPIYFNRSMQSIFDDQTLKPSQIVLVQDGFLTEVLCAEIKKWQHRLGDVLKIIVLEENLGLGVALNIGLACCHHDLVAHMDTDDIAHPDRFKIQVEYMIENLGCDILGSAVTEFDDKPDFTISSRIVPLIHDDIVLYAQKRNPFNHPSVIYRKSAIADAGGYKKINSFEDYYLWVRMIKNGSRCANISMALVSMRVGYSMLARRGGIDYIINETSLQRKFLDLGFITLFQFIKNLLIRIPVRLLPNRLRGLVYRYIRSLS
jgi:glycosyltransferase involved in cell wall biosynthesis